MASINEIEGIGEVTGAKLIAAGIKTVEGLLSKGATKAGRKEIADASGIDEGKILSWVNMADLFRIKGIGSEFSELLVASGVDTVKELSTRKAENLHAKITEVNDAKSLTRTVPNLDKITDFIEQAKALEPVVTH